MWNKKIVLSKNQYLRFKTSFYLQIWHFPWMPANNKFKCKGKIYITLYFIVLYIGIFLCKEKLWVTVTSYMFIHASWTFLHIKCTICLKRYKFKDLVNKIEHIDQSNACPKPKRQTRLLYICPFSLNLDICKQEFERPKNIDISVKGNTFVKFFLFL